MFKEIETPRLLLRKLKLEDQHDVFEYGQDAEVSKYVTWNKHESIEDAINYINFILKKYEVDNSITWAIQFKECNKMIGTIDFITLNDKHKFAELGYALNREYWNKGIMTEALKAVIHYGFSSLDLNKIYARSFEQNTGSYRIMEKVGMSFEGIQRQHMIKDGKFFDIRCYSILKNEYLNQ